MGKPNRDGEIGEVVVVGGQAWLWLGGRERWVKADEAQPDIVPAAPFLLNDD